MVGTAIKKEEFTELSLAFSAAAVGLGAAFPVWAETRDAQPAADRLPGEHDAVFLAQGFGEVGEVEVMEVVLVKSDDSFAQGRRAGIMRAAAAVAVEDAGVAFGADLGLQPEDLADAATKYPCRLGGQKPRAPFLKQPTDNPQPD